MSLQFFWGQFFFCIGTALMQRIAHFCQIRASSAFNIDCENIIFGTDEQNCPYQCNKKHFFSNSEHIILCVRHLQANALRNLLKQNVHEKTRNSIVQKHFFQKQAFSVQRTGVFFIWKENKKFLMNLQVLVGHILRKN